MRNDKWSTEGEKKQTCFCLTVASALKQERGSSQHDRKSHSYLIESVEFSILTNQAKYR